MIKPLTDLKIRCLNQRTMTTKHLMRYVVQIQDHVVYMQRAINKKDETIENLNKQSNLLRHKLTKRDNYIKQLEEQIEKLKTTN